MIVKVQPTLLYFRDFKKIHWCMIFYVSITKNASQYLRIEWNFKHKKGPLKSAINSATIKECPLSIGFVSGLSTLQLNIRSFSFMSILSIISKTNVNYRALLNVQYYRCVVHCRLACLSEWKYSCQKSSTSELSLKVSLLASFSAPDISVST